MSENKCRRQGKQNDLETSEHAFRVCGVEFWDAISWTMMSIISCGRSGDFRIFLASIRFEGFLALTREALNTGCLSSECLTQLRSKVDVGIKL
jgi:hypothetical protein